MFLLRVGAPGLHERNRRCCRPGAPTRRSACEVSGLVLALLALLAFQPRTFGQSPPQLALQLTGGNAHLSVTGDPGSPCAVQYATNLAPGGAWVTLTNYTLFGSNGLVVVPAGATSSGQFYRVLITVPTNMAWVEPGSFVMGSPTNEAARNADETQFAVTLTNGFYVSKYLVTQGAYLALMNTNPSYYNTNNLFTQDLTRPVEEVSWSDATNYCAILTQQAQAAGQIFTNWTYRLPTEAQWEYACRGGTTTPLYYGSNLLSGMANFDGDYQYIGGFGNSNNPSGVFLDRTASVGSYQPNPAGLYDMAGNVWEWCEDWYGAYPTNGVINPQGPATGTRRVLRGGTLDSTGSECRSANRDDSNPSSRFDTVGFRVVLSAGP
jgi:formylglycine-generating enzyme required for sulfatase activity